MPPVPTGRRLVGDAVVSFRVTFQELPMRAGKVKTMDMQSRAGSERGTSGLRRALAVVTKDTRGDWWVARNGAAYNWLANIGAPRADPLVSSDTAVVVALGVNDLISALGTDDDVLGSSDTAHYIALINRMAEQWVSRGAVVYYASVTPVGSETGDNVYRASKGNTVTNAQIRSWNVAMRSGLSANVKVLDAYSTIAGDYAASDSLHYDDATYLRLYDFARRSVT